MFKVNNKTPERRHWRHSFAYIVRRSGVFIVNFKHLSRVVLVFLLLNLSM